MRLRRSHSESNVETSTVTALVSAWDGLPMTAAPSVVIRAARAGDVVAPAELLQSA